jgi:hypothetical protein
LKIITLFVLLSFLHTPLFAQEETLLKGKIESGGFGGPILKVTELNGDLGLLVGGKGGWIINHTFVIGGGGYGLVTNIAANDVNFIEKAFLNLGYGGVVLELVPESNKLIHFSFSTLIGAGGVNYRDRNFSINFRQWDTFFVAEPEVNLMLNVTKHFRVGLGASYRYIDGVDLNGLRDSDLSGASASMIFKFGKF